MELKSVLRYLVAYLAWIATSALAVLLLFLSRTSYLVILKATGAGLWQWNAADKALFIVVGIGVLCFIIATEIYFVNGVHKARLLRRACRIAGVELLAVFGCQLVSGAVAGSLASSALGLLLLAVEVLAGAALFVLSLIAPAQRGITAS